MVDTATPLAGRRSPALTPLEVCGRSLLGFETGTARWLLDPTRRRCLRVPHGEPFDFRVLLAHWTTYHHVVGDAHGNLTLVLDADAQMLVHLCRD